MVIVTDDESSSVERPSNDGVSEESGQPLGYGGCDSWKRNAKESTRENRKTAGGHVTRIPVTVPRKDFRFMNGSEVVLRMEPWKASVLTVANTKVPSTATQPPGWAKALAAPRPVALAETRSTSEYLPFGRWLAKSGFPKRPVAADEPDSPPLEPVPGKVVERSQVKPATPAVVLERGSSDARVRLAPASEPKGSSGPTKRDKEKLVKIIYGNQKRSKAGPEQKKIAKSNNELMKRILNAKSSVSSLWKS